MRLINEPLETKEKSSDTFNNRRLEDYLDSSDMLLSYEEHCNLKMEHSFLPGVLEVTVDAPEPEPFNMDKFKSVLNFTYLMAVELDKRYPGMVVMKKYEALGRIIEEEKYEECIKNNRIGRSGIVRFLLSSVCVGDTWFEHIRSYLTSNSEDTHDHNLMDRVYLFNDREMYETYLDVNKELASKGLGRFNCSNCSLEFINKEITLQKNLEKNKNLEYTVCFSPYYEDIICLSTTEGLDSGTCYRPKSEYNIAPHMLGSSKDAVVVYVIDPEGKRIARAFGILSNERLYLHNVYKTKEESVPTLTTACKLVAKEYGFKPMTLERIDGNNMYINSGGSRQSFNYSGENESLIWTKYAIHPEMESRGTCCACGEYIPQRGSHYSVLHNTEDMVCGNCFNNSPDFAVCSWSGEAHLTNECFTLRNRSGENSYVHNSYLDAVNERYPRGEWDEDSNTYYTIEKKKIAIDAR